MKYFLLKSDNNLNNLVKMRDFKTGKKMVFLKSDVEQLNDMSTLYIEGDKYSIFPDLIEVPVPLISDDLKKVFEMYDDTLVYKTTILTNLEEGIQKIYRLIICDIVYCISDKTIYHKNGLEKEFILDKEMIGDYDVFYIQGKEGYHLVVSLQVVESMLRRNIIGITFEEVKVV